MSGGVQILGSEHADERRRRLLEATEAGGQLAIDAVLKALGDEDWRVRKEAIGLLDSVPAQALVPGLVEAIAQGDNVGLRNSAIEAVAVLGELAVPALIEAFETRDGAQRRFFVAALGASASVDASDALVAACDDPDENLVAAAIDALARVGGPKAEHAIRRRLSSSDAFRRMAALDALDRLEAFVPFEELEPLLVDPSVRGAAIGALGRSRSFEALAPLLETLSGRAQSVAARAAIALAQLAESSDELSERVAADVAAIPEIGRTHLRRLVVAGDRQTRRAAALLLVLCRDTASLRDVLALASDVSLTGDTLYAFSAWGLGAVAPLLEVVGATTGVIRALAIELAADLVASAGPAAPDALVTRVRATVLSFLASTDEPSRDAAIRSFTSFAQPSDIERLVGLATSSRTDDALRAAAAIEGFLFGHRDAIERALELVDVSLGGGALCTVLAKLGTDDAFRRVVACTSAEDPSTRRAAVLALGENDRGVESLALALADEDVDVRATAAMMLGRLRDAEGRAIGAERLLSAIQHELPIVQISAIQALVDLGEPRVRDQLAGLTTSQDAGVVAASINALRALGDDRTPSLALAAALRNDDVDVLSAALAVVGDRKLDSAGEGLVLAALSHAERSVRLAAIDVAATSTEGRALLRKARSSERDPLIVRALDEALGAEAD